MKSCDFNQPPFLQSYTGTVAGARSFTYDTLNRVLTAQTPSTWGVSFTNGGNGAPGNAANVNAAKFCRECGFPCRRCK